MSARIPTAKKGDRLVWVQAGASVVHIEVTRVSADGWWADIRCTDSGGATWTKRQRLPFPEGMRRKLP